jgi:putative protease
VRRATLHPELNLAQIRDIKKCIETEIIIYGKIPLMQMGNPKFDGVLTDRKNAKFFVHGGTLYNSVPVFMADKLGEIEKTGITHCRLIFTTETADDVCEIINAHTRREMLKIDFTRGKFFSKV